MALFWAEFREVVVALVDVVVVTGLVVVEVAAAVVPAAGVVVVAVGLAAVGPVVAGLELVAGAEPGSAGLVVVVVEAGPVTRVVKWRYGKIMVKNLKNEIFN